MTIKFGEFGAHLGTRFIGAIIREDVENALPNKEIVVIFDFKGVETVSNNFADECYGKLTSDFDKSVIQSRIQFKNATPFIKTMFEKSISNDRLEYA